MFRVCGSRSDLQPKPICLSDVDPVPKGSQVLIWGILSNQSNDSSYKSPTFYYIGAEDPLR